MGRTWVKNVKTRVLATRILGSFLIFLYKLIFNIFWFGFGRVGVFVWDTETETETKFL